MTLLATIIGYLIIACIAVVVACWALMAVAWAWRRTIENQWELAARRVGADLLSNSWWFSESQDTMRALQLIAGRLMRDGSCGMAIEEVRTDWRNERNYDGEVRSK